MLIVVVVALVVLATRGRSRRGYAAFEKKAPSRPTAGIKRRKPTTRQIERSRRVQDRARKARKALKARKARRWDAQARRWNAQAREWKWLKEQGISVLRGGKIVGGADHPKPKTKVSVVWNPFSKEAFNWKTFWKDWKI